jgi:FK506-binding protein 1
VFLAEAAGLYGLDKLKMLWVDAMAEKRVIEAGDVPPVTPQRGDELTVHYTGTYGAVPNEFDSSRSKGYPLKFIVGVGQVIRGWDEAMMQMRLGERAVLRIGSDFAYGKAGVPGIVPPDTNLDFDVELLAIGTSRSKAFEAQEKNLALLLAHQARELPVEEWEKKLTKKEKELEEREKQADWENAMEELD